MPCQQVKYVCLDSIFKRSSRGLSNPISLVSNTYVNTICVHPRCKLALSTDSTRKIF